MTDDLTALLRDAGREPTIDLDVDALHGRGRRRAVGRRVAVGAGALALLGVLGAGVATLLDAPDAPLIDQAPSEDAAPAEDGGDEEKDRRTPTAAMSDLGVTVVDVVRSQDGAGGLQTRVVTADGVVEEFWTAAGALPPLGSRVVVTEDRRLWLTDVDANLIVGGPDDAGRPVLRAQDGVGWTLLGTSEDGSPLVTPAAGQEGQFTGDEVRKIFVLEADTEVEGAPGSLTGIAGIDVRALWEDQSPVAADAMPEHLAVLTSAGESSTAWLFRAGEPEPVTLAQTGDVDSWFIDIAFHEEEIWIVTGSPTGADLWIGSMDGGPVRRVPTPVGRGEDADAFVVDLQSIFGTDGVSAMTLSTATPDDENGVAWSIDVQAARDAAVEAELAPDAEVPVGVYDVLDAQGHVHLLPPPSDEPAELAACATDEDVRLNVKPAFPAGHVWWLCWDAMAQLPDDVAHPLVATELFTGGDGRVVDAAGLEALLEAWAAGPPTLAAEAGLSGGLNSDVATIQGVAIVDGRVTIDILGGSQVGVLGTSTGRATFVQQLAGMVFQFDGNESMEIRVDGSCEAWTDLADVDPGCQVYDESVAPWAQADPADQAN